MHTRTHASHMDEQAEIKSLVTSRPVESHGGARENIIAGPYHTPFLYVLRSRHQRRRDWCPLTIRLGVRGSVVSSPSGVRGRALAENGFYAYFRSERSHLEHHFQYF